jgi:hypothetical protein
MQQQLRSHIQENICVLKERFPARAACRQGGQVLHVVAGMALLPCYAQQVAEACTRADRMSVTAFNVEMQNVGCTWCRPIACLFAEVTGHGVWHLIGNVMVNAFAKAKQSVPL